MADRVSVIIPTWNRGGTIIRAVTSALAQTRPPLEVLVCDDGSNDDTEALVREIDDPRVRWLAGPRGGRPAIPRNRGIAAAQGDLLAFLDSDDAWQPEKLERQLTAMDAARVDAACCDATRVLPDGQCGGRLLGGETALLDLSALLRVNRVICSSAVVRRDVVAKVGGFPEEPGLRALEDYALWLKVATMTRFAYVGEALVDYADDMTTSVRRDQKDGWTQRLTVLRDFDVWCKTVDAGSPVRRATGYEIFRAWSRRLAWKVIR